MMCYECWEHAGKPAITTPAVIAAAALVGRVFDLNHVGGNLHSVIEDWNLDNDNLAACREVVTNKRKNEAGDGYADDPDLLKAETICLDALERMSQAERFSTLALHDRFVTP